MCLAGAMESRIPNVVLNRMLQELQSSTGSAFGDQPASDAQGAEEPKVCSSVPILRAQEMQKALDGKGLERFGKTRNNPRAPPKYPLGESNLSQLSAFMPSTYKESVMPGGAKSGATADETVEFPHSAATGTGTSLVEVIRLLSVMAPGERAALIDFLKTWG